MRHWLRIYGALLRMGWSTVMEYRAQIVIWMTNSLLMVTMMLVWLGISSAGPVNGYTSADFVAYFMIGWVVRNLTAVWVSWELDYRIREGKLSPMLLRPMHPIHHDIAFHWAEKGLRSVIVLPIAALVLLLTPNAPLKLDVPTLLAFTVSLFMAWAIKFMIDFSLGVLAFWLSQASAFFEVFYGLTLVLTGAIAPLAMFPEAIQQALWWSPFPYMLSFPVEIALGRITGEALTLGLGVQAAWALLCTAVAALMWRLALRSYTAVGA